MSWGTELWDQFDQVAQHTQKGIDFCEKYNHFLKERCQIEMDYASKLKKLVKSHTPKKKEEEDYEYTAMKGFLNMIREISDIAGQHEVIAETLASSIMNDLNELILQLKQERKRHLQEASKQMNTLQQQLNVLERSKKSYEKAFRESDKAQEAHRKADADLNLSRAEVEKAKSISILRSQANDATKRDYASELQKTNHAQNEHYHQLMPQVFHSLQSLEERRIVQSREFFRKSADVERKIIPIVNACIDGMIKSAESIDPATDAQIVVSKHKSGFQPPGDIPFEDLSLPTVEQLNHSGSNTPRNSTGKSMRGSGTVSGRSKNRRGIFDIFSKSKTDDTKEDFSHLPPSQQKRKLIGKVEIIKQHIAKETAERDGLLKMKDVYTANPSMGDPNSLAKQLDENAQKLDGLNAELQKFSRFITEAEAKISQTNGVHNQGGNGHGNNHDSIHHSASQVSVSSGGHGSLPSSHLPSAPGTPSVNHNGGAQDSPDNNRGEGSLHHPPTYLGQDSFEDELEEAIGKATALYPFDGNNEGSIKMAEGEVLSIIESDQGDGWTRVQRSNDDEGFVPTTYIQCTYFEN